MSTALKTKEAIQYIQPGIPDFATPSYAGHRYEAWVPDTLDLQARCALAINGLTGPTDPEADYEIYWAMYMYGDRPVMRHDHNDHVQIKFHEALPLMRLASGSRQNEHVERRWMEVVLHMRGPDGLLYYPVVGRPWASTHLFPEQFGAVPGDHFAQPYNNGRLLAAVAAYHGVTGDDLWLEVGRGMVDGLWRWAVDRGEYAYFSKGQYALGETSDPNAPVPPPWMTLPFAWTLMGLAQFFRFTGYEPAGRLARKLTACFKDHANYFGPDARFLPEEPDSPDHPERAHLHGHCYPLLGMLDLALATGDRELASYVAQGYEYARQQGDVLMGFFPAEVDPRRRQTSEICGVADMVALAVKLTEAGARDCWDDIDRWTRNMLVEGQLTRCDWMYRVNAGQPHVPIDPVSMTDDRVGERNLGGCACSPSPNDFFGGRENGQNSILAGCCTGNGLRALYYAWQSILTHRDGRLRVNLLFNRASPWADVDSHIPYEGKVEVKVKVPVELELRIPEWVKPGEVRVQVNGQDREPGWAGRYAQAGAVRPGDVATLTFPIFERSERVQIQKQPYTLVRKGNDIVFVDPPGRYAPLFQRDHYRENSTRWRKVERFVADKPLHW